MSGRDLTIRTVLYSTCIRSGFARAHRKITELEEELRIVGNNMKSLELSEQEVRVVFADVVLLSYTPSYSYLYLYSRVYEVCTSTVRYTK